jgi:hypothetical protein
VGLGNNRYNQILSLKDRRRSISADLAHDLDRKAVIHSMALSQQGSWTKWRSDVSPPDHKWQDLIFLNNPKIFSHYLNASINSLPSPNRLHSWGFIPSAKCPLCDNPKGTQMHIFSNCKTALTQGRYSWRHDSVLNCLELTLSQHIKSHNEEKIAHRPKSFINFIKAGTRGPSASMLPPAHLLSPAHDWQSLFDYHDHSITPH